LLCGPLAHAGVITESSVGDTFIIDWLLEAGAEDGNGNTNNTGQDISAMAEFGLLAFDIDNDFIDLAVSVTNTTAPNDDEIGLWKLGFGTTPDATSVLFLDADDGELVDAVLGAPGAANAFPDSAVIDVTTSTDPGTPRLLLAGETDAFVLRIGFDDLNSGFEITLDPFNAFFQSDPDSFQVSSASVPAPTPLSLLGLGLLVLGGYHRRRRGRTDKLEAR